MKTRLQHFKELRQKIDELTDDFPLDKGMWLQYSDLNDAISSLEQAYNRQELVKEKQ